MTTPTERKIQRLSSREHYWRNPEKERERWRKRYWENVEETRKKRRDQYRKRAEHYRKKAREQYHERKRRQLESASETNGRTLRMWRERRGYTAKQVADLTNTTEAAITRQERGETNPSFKMMWLLSDLYGVSAQELFFSRKEDGEKL